MPADDRQHQAWGIPGSRASSVPLRMRSILIPLLLAHVRKLGHDPGDLIRRFGLGADAESESSVLVSLDVERALFEAAEEITGDAFLGVQLAEAVSRGTFDVLELSCVAAPTVGAATRRLARYHRLLNDLIVVTVRDEAGLVVIEHEIPGSPLCGGRHVNEFFVANFLLHARRATGRVITPRFACFAHAIPSSVNRLRSLVGTSDLRFGVGKNGLALEAADAEAPMLTSDPALLRVLDRYAERELAARGPIETLRDQVRAEIVARLGDGVPALEDIARALRLAPRTVQRRLREEGVAFKEVVESVREALALELAQDPRRTNAMIALALGYSDTHTFFRAFRRWTGTTPSRLRGRIARIDVPRDP